MLGVIGAGEVIYCHGVEGYQYIRERRNSYIRGSRYFHYYSPYPYSAPPLPVVIVER